MRALPFRPPVLVLFIALIATVMGMGDTSAETPDAGALRSVAPAVSTNTLALGDALVAWTDHASLANGWYTLEVTSGSVELDQSIPVPGREGMDSTWTGTWFRDDYTGNFQVAHDHTELRLRHNGDLALISAGGRQLWHSRTQGKGVVQLELRHTGLLVLTTKSGRIVWSSHSGQVLMSGGMRLEPGQRLRSAWVTQVPGRKPTTLTMQRNGNLVYRCGSRVVWQTRTHVRGSALQMSSNGILRVITPKGHVAWRSSSDRNHDYAYFTLEGMVVFADGIIWEATYDSTKC